MVECLTVLATVATLLHIVGTFSTVKLERSVTVSTYKCVKAGPTLTKFSKCQRHLEDSLGGF